MAKKHILNLQNITLCGRKTRSGAEHHNIDGNSQFHLGSINNLSYTRDYTLDFTLVPDGLSQGYTEGLVSQVQNDRTVCESCRQAFIKIANSAK